MHPVLERVVSQAGDRGDWDRQAEAIRQLWFFMRAKNRPDGTGYYEEGLPDDLRSLDLQEADERELVDELYRLLLSARSAREWGSLTSPLAYARPRYAIGPALELLERSRQQGWSQLGPLDPHGIVVVIDNALDTLRDAKDKFRSDGPVVVAAIREHDPRPALDEVVALQGINSDHAEGVRNTIEEHVFPPAKRRPGLLGSLKHRK